jgi:hypothetical protein
MGFVSAFTAAFRGLYSNTPVLISEDESYLGAGDGRVITTPNFGVAPYVYSWTRDGLFFPSAFKDIVNLIPALYEVTIIDALGAVRVANVVINAGLPQLISFVTITNTTQHNSSDGTATVVAVGGTGSYIYSMPTNSNGGFSPAFSSAFVQSGNFDNIIQNLPEGDYEVLVTSGNQNVRLYFTIDSPRSYVFSYQNIPTNNPTIYSENNYQILYATNVNATSNTGFTINSNSGTIFLPVGNHIFSGTYINEFGYQENLVFDIYSFTTYTCSDFRISRFDIANNTLSVDISTFVGDTIYYKLDYESNPSVFTDPIINIRGGKRSIKFLNSAGCTITKEFTVYNRVPVDNKNAFTMSYNPDAGSQLWISFHSYQPQFMINTSDRKWFTLQDENFYIQNSSFSSTGLFYDQIKPQYIDLVFNAGEAVEWQSFEWNNLSITDKGVYLYDNTIDYVSVRNNYQLSGKVAIEKECNVRRYYQDYKRARFIKDFWIFNHFRDRSRLGNKLVKDILSEFELIETNLLPENTLYYKLARFFSKHIILRLENDNLDNKEIFINAVNANVKQIVR